MESAAEADITKFEIGTVLDERKDFVTTEVESKRIYQAPGNSHLYAKPIGGIVAMVALLFVPMITLPGLILLVLVAEIYLLDWTYSNVSRVRDDKSVNSKETVERSPDNEIDRKVVRTGPKDQFVR